jgi:ubiquitin carboxyl-terminal hydrolase 5/13
VGGALLQGFQLDSQKFDIVKDYGLMVLKGGERVVVPFPNTAVPEFVGRAVQAVIDHQGASLQAQAQAWVDDEKRPVSKYAVALEQVDNGVRISNNPSSWKCADSGATDNLWLNLSTGYIGSGRPQYLREYSMRHQLSHVY